MNLFCFLYFLSCLMAMYIRRCRKCVTTHCNATTFVVSSAHDHSHGFDPGSAAPLFTNFPSGLQDPDAYTFTAGWEPASVGCQSYANMVDMVVEM